jgi:hypothetical protein
MIVMPASASGWLWHSLARETGRIGHLYSPRDQRGPWPWIPYSLDNGAFSCWNPVDNTFDSEKWAEKEQSWRELLMWCQCAPIQPKWAVVPDVPGQSAATLERWHIYAPEVQAAKIPLALAVQDGMTPETVRQLAIKPDVIFVGGSTEWKWDTAEMWCKEFPRVHVGRVNNVEKLYMLESFGAESCDGTGWNRGDRKRTAGVEQFCRSKGVPTTEPLWPYASRAIDKKQLSFA